MFRVAFTCCDTSMRDKLEVNKFSEGISRKTESINTFLNNKKNLKIKLYS